MPVDSFVKDEVGCRNFLSADFWTSLMVVEGFSAASMSVSNSIVGCRGFCRLILVDKLIVEVFVVGFRLESCQFVVSRCKVVRLL